MPRVDIPRSLRGELIYGHLTRTLDNCVQPLFEGVHPAVVRELCAAMEPMVVSRLSWRGATGPLCPPGWWCRLLAHVLACALPKPSNTYASHGTEQECPGLLSGSLRAKALDAPATKVCWGWVWPTARPSVLSLPAFQLICAHTAWKARRLPSMALKIRQCFFGRCSLLPEACMRCVGAPASLGLALFLLLA